MALPWGPTCPGSLWLCRTDFLDSWGYRAWLPLPHGLSRGSLPALQARLMAALLSLCFLQLTAAPALVDVNLSYTRTFTSKVLGLLRGRRGSSEALPVYPQPRAGKQMAPARPHGQTLHWSGVTLRPLTPLPS